MTATLGELLAPQVVLEMVSRIKDGRGPLAAWLGWYPTRLSGQGRNVSPTGPNTLRGTGSLRTYTYRIMDHTRVPMRMRAPATGPSTITRNPVAQNTVAIGRWHQKIPLLYEQLGQLAQVVGPNTKIDEGGQDYITRQETFCIEQGNNAVEMMAAGMMRDSLYMIEVGDDYYPSFTAPSNAATGALGIPQTGFQVNFLIPAGNKNQLNMLGTGNIIGVPWNNVAAPIFGNMQSIIAAFAQVSRYNVTEAWINSLMWVNIITNTEIRNLAGSAATPFAEYAQVADGGMDDSGPANHYKAILKALPFIEWHFCDDTLALQTDIDPVYTTVQPTAFASGALAKLVPDTMVIFSHKPSSKWQRLYLGGEYVVENPGQPGALRMGWHAWHEYTTQPSAVELLFLLNATPALYVPTVVAPATVVF